MRPTDQTVSRVFILFCFLDSKIDLEVIIIIYSSVINLANLV